MIDGSITQTDEGSIHKVAAQILELKAVMVGPIGIIMGNSLKPIDELFNQDQELSNYKFYPNNFLKTFIFRYTPQKNISKKHLMDLINEKQMIN